MEQIILALLDRAPVGILSWIGGLTCAAGIVFFSSKMKIIPFKVTLGTKGIQNSQSFVRGNGFITREDLRINCENRQRSLDSNLREIISNTQKTHEDIGTIKDRLSYMEGALEGALGIRKPNT